MLKGIDISEFQTVDYKKLKKQGIDFAIIRCGYGRNISQEDKKFKKHYEGLKSVGIKIGCYLYSYVTSVQNAKLEAENCLKIIKGLQFDLPVFYDLEDKVVAKLGKEKITNCALNFCETIEKAGYKAGVYANLNWFLNYINVSKILKYKIWLAEWSQTHTSKFRIDYWQYSSKGKIDGINGNVDLDISYVDNVDNSVENGENVIKKKTNSQIAKEVIAGKWGNGKERKEKLEKAGYNYNEIQNLVNKKVK